MAALFESALGDAAARRPRDAAQWPELVALVDAATPVIADALRETDPAQIDTLMRVLDAVAPRAAPILPPLVQALRHQRPEVRRGAATVLGAMGHAGSGAAADLRRALDDDDAGVRAAAADALRRIEATPSPVRPRN
jgi:HEAT repeat protein